MLTQNLDDLYLAPEADVVARLLKKAHLDENTLSEIKARAEILVTHVRERAKDQDLVDAFMGQYELSTQEGVLLMCLAEALLRIPDAPTAKKLLRDKLGQADFEKYLNRHSSFLVNASTKALQMTTSLLKEDHHETWSGRLKNLLARSSEPVIRRAAFQAMRLLSGKFVVGRTIKQALGAARVGIEKGYSYSFDMLGEGAQTTDDARRYFEEYKGALLAVAALPRTLKGLDHPGVSIKLSALHPRYEHAQEARLLKDLIPTLKELCLIAQKENLMLTIDAEEADRLELSLKVFKALYEDPDLQSWQGLGLAVQAYQKRALGVLEFLKSLSTNTRKKIPVRLVKGAYWDTEIKRAQERGLEDYPVFTRKASTDVSYLVCAQYLLENNQTFLPAFATHNARTLATIIALAKDRRNFEFQRLHGMGETLYETLVGTQGAGYLCRVYAPVGAHQDLLPYLVRRLLENGANSSFVNKIADPTLPLDVLNQDPVEYLQTMSSLRHPTIPLPRDLYGPERLNSMGLEFSKDPDLNALIATLDAFSFPVSCFPLVGGAPKKTDKVIDKACPFQKDLLISSTHQADEKTLLEALTIAEKAFDQWSETSAIKRAEILTRAADLLEARLAEFMALCVYEGGKTLPDALSEVREATDFCRYYANEGVRQLQDPLVLPGPTGEKNSLTLVGRGVFACISPWNFPLAIFMGQVSAALMAGNTVLAKPAAQTPLIAQKIIDLLHEAGIPKDVLHFLPCPGSLFGTVVLGDPRLRGVAFTGSTHTAWQINETLAKKKGVIVPLIAETGGQNVMIVDSSALIEQVVKDVISSSFQSAGQRCSALRILFVQEDIAPRFMQMLKGAMAELVLGDPRHLKTDVGPVIDEGARKELSAHQENMTRNARLLYQCDLPREVADLGTFVAPSAFVLESLDLLDDEKFGPILHILTFKGADLDEVIQKINALGFGLTFGLHTRLDSRIAEVSRKIKAGNLYINRNMIGAVVGVQPFGGQGLSGTGPKAGGPHYLQRFTTEKTISVDITAQGGNAQLMTLGE
jgi:RHH-type proline utilization regulon transcriptional repressor/proline dehydrogenase/delta 1-pyrroline-5-carboxylate dehydrogenase